MAITTTEAVANRVKLALYEESTYGVPATGDFETLRFTTDGLEAQESSVVSAEVLSDRRTDSIVRTDFSVNSPVTMEITHPRETAKSTAYESLIKTAMFASDFGTQGAEEVMAGNSIDITASSGTFDCTGDVPADFPQAGELIRISAADDSSNDGFYYVATSATPLFTVTNLGGLVNDTGSNLTIQTLGFITEGTTLCSLGIERQYTGSVLTNDFGRFNGLMVDRWARDVPVDGIATDTFTFLGKDEVARYTPTVMSGGSLVARTTTTPITSKVGDHSFWIGANKIDNIAFSFEVANNLRARSVAGILGAKSIGEGSVGITGRASLFLEDGVGDVDDLFIADTRTSITRVISDAAGNAQVMHFPQCKITRSPRGASGGKDSDIVVPIDFSVETDDTQGIMMAYGHYTA